MTTIRAGDLDFGGAILEAADGTKLAVVEVAGTIYIYSAIDGTPNLEDSDTSTTAHGGGATEWIHAAIDSADNIHIISSCSTEQTRDVAYCIATESAGAWTLGTWEEAANYTNVAPNSPGCAISLDSNGKPFVEFVDNTKVAGSAQDNTYVIDKTGASWANLVQIGARVTKTYNYNKPHLTLRNSDYIEAFYYFQTGGTDPAYKSNTGSWGSESVYTENLAGIGNVVSTSGGTVYRYHTLYSSPYSIEENNTSTGYIVNASLQEDLTASPALDGTDRYILYIDTSFDVHLIYNTGSGWTDGSAQQTGTFERVIACWSYNNYNVSGEIIYMYSDGTNIYYDAYSLAAGITINAAAGVLTATPKQASIQVDLSVDASAGVLTATGQTAIIIAAVSITISGNPGVLTASGQIAAILVPEIVSAAAGIITASGQQAAISSPDVVLANPGIITATGLQALIEIALSVDAAAGVLTATGKQASIDVNLSVDAAAGVLTATGLQAQVGAITIVSINAGILTATPQQASINVDLSVDAAAAQLQALGMQASILVPNIVSAVAGVLTGTGMQASISSPDVVNANPGILTASGQQSSIGVDLLIAAAAGLLTATGKQALISSGNLIVASPGILTATPQQATILSPALISASAAVLTASGQQATIQVPNIVQASAGVLTMTGLQALIYSFLYGQTPAIRALFVDAESRVVIADAESRIFVVSTESRIVITD